LVGYQHYQRYLLFFHVGKGIGKFSTGNELVHYWQEIGLLNILANIKSGCIALQCSLFNTTCIEKQCTWPLNGTYYISHLGLRGYRLLVLVDYYVFCFYFIFNSLVETFLVNFKRCQAWNSVVFVCA